MNSAERKRVEAAGWQFGSAADFLGLSEEETVYIDLRVRLANALKVRRQAARLSQKAFASARKSSQSRVAKAEANDPSVSLDLVIRSLIALGVSVNELASIIGFEENRSTLPIATVDSKPKRKESKESPKGLKRNTVKPA
jgi:transcriptional regulator with XRE-family HTH domain